jgi:dihydrofolate reductase
MIAMVVATDKKGVIGREDQIPWRIRTDLANLKRLTKEHPVILGRKTYESMDMYYTRSGREMPGSMYIVVTRNEGYHPARQNATVAHSIEEAIALAKSYHDDQIYVNGGAAIFEAMMPYTDRIYLTVVQTEAEGDAHFPKIDDKVWRELSIENHTKDEKNEYDFDMLVLERIKR